MPAQSAAAAREASYVAGLAKFFPEASPVRIPVRLTRLGSAQPVVESTVIEFGTSREVLFATSSSLEFADRLRLQTPDGSLDVEACVVAVQYHEGHTAVAARFSHPVPNWIVKS
ncbi:MAG TPA: hypothetical protein VFI95_13840 [Terriglobales bacterium]|nr:hypothetical protein [Terriglobales bacterium]